MALRPLLFLFVIRANLCPFNLDLLSAQTSSTRSTVSDLVQGLRPPSSPSPPPCAHLVSLAKMYCQLHRPVTSGSQVACALGHVGDRIYWIQKGFYLPDALGIVPPPYFPILHVGITALVLILLAKAVFIDPLQELNILTLSRGRNKLAGGGHAFFLKRYWRQVIRTLFEIFVVSSVVCRSPAPPFSSTSNGHLTYQLNIIFLCIFRNTDVVGTGGHNPDIYSPIMRNKLHRHGIIF